MRQNFIDWVDSWSKETKMTAIGAIMICIAIFLPNIIPVHDNVVLVFLLGGIVICVGAHRMKNPSKDDTKSTDKS
jgi:hypothetical protein